MNLRDKTLISEGLSLIGLILVLYVVAHVELLTSFSSLEESNAQINVERALNAISNELTNLGDLANYWATRNDTNDFMATGDTKFIKYNIANGSLTNESLYSMGIDLLLFLDTYGQVAFSRYINLTGEGDAVPQKLIEQLSLYGLCPGCVGPQSKFAGIILLFDQPVLIVAQPITNNLRKVPPRGRVVLGRYLTKKEVYKLSTITQLNITICPLIEGHIPPDFEQVRPLLSYDSPTAIKLLSQDRIAGYALLESIYGNPLLILRVDSRRDLYRQGMRSMSSFIAIFSGAGLLFLIMMLVYMDRSVLSPLSKLTEGVNGIGITQNIAARLNIKGKDELANLARSINRMLAALEMSSKELVNSERRYKAVVEDQPDLICRYLSDSTITFVNDAFCKFFSRQFGEIIGSKVDQFADYGNMKSAEDLKTRLNNRSPSLTYESRFLIGGAWRWILWTNRGIFDEFGTLIEIQSIGREITELKIAEEALKHSQRRQADIIDFLPDALMAIDKEGKLIVWNKAMEVLTGSKAKDMLGKGNHEYSLPFYGYRRPVLIDMVLYPCKDFESEYANFKREETAVFGEVFIPTLGQHGSYLLAKATALFDAAGNIVGAIESVRDITERREMEQKLERSRAELRIAAEIQKSFIPRKTPAVPSFEVAAATKPAMEVGGDFYDFISLPDGRLGVVIADVAGKSIPAALFMALSRMIIRASATHQIKTSEVLKNANNMIAMDATAGMFVTLLYGILDGEGRTLNYADAGHPVPLIFRAEKLGYEEEEVSGIALGAEENAEYGERKITFLPGDLAVFFTDGVTEAMNPDGEMFGFSRLAEVVAAYHTSSAKELLEKILGEISIFSKGAEQHDDITLIVLKAQEQKRDCCDLIVAAEEVSIPRIAACIDERMSGAGFGDKEILEAQLAVEEACINIIRHGYRGAKGDIRIALDLEDNRLKAIIEDDAPPFDPTQFEKPSFADSIDERPIGGLGIHLMRSLVDDWTYEFRNGRNRLILIKKAGCQTTSESQ